MIGSLPVCRAALRPICSHPHPKHPPPAPLASPRVAGRRWSLPRGERLSGRAGGDGGGQAPRGGNAAPLASSAGFHGDRERGVSVCRCRSNDRQGKHVFLAVPLRLRRPWFYKGFHACGFGPPAALQSEEPPAPKSPERFSAAIRIPEVTVSWCPTGGLAFPENPLRGSPPPPPLAMASPRTSSLTLNPSARISRSTAPRRPKHARIRTRIHTQKRTFTHAHAHTRGNASTLMHTRARVHGHARTHMETQAHTNTRMRTLENEVFIQ